MYGLKRTILTAAISAALGAAPLAAAEGDKPATTVDASKGGFTIKSGDNSITFGAYTQIRYTGEKRDLGDNDPVGTLGAGQEDGWTNSFDVARIRLSMRGTMYKPWLKYVFAYELGRTSGESSSKIKDGYLEFANNPLATFRVGQFKVPFSLQELTGDEYQAYVDRAITNQLAVGRDQGAMIYGTTAAKAFGYQVGVFNGSAESTRQDDKKVLWAARVYTDPLGEYKTQEGTFEKPEKNIVHFGLALRTGEIVKGPDTTGGTPIFEDSDNQTAWNLEFAWKLRSLWATAEYFNQKTDRENPAPTLASVKVDGWHAQFGWAPIDALELGLRYATVDFNKDVADSKQNEIRGVATYAFNGHNLKIQSDVGQVEYEANAPGRGTRLASATGQGVKDKQLRVQFQLKF